jgi:hypothetical protein
MSSCFGGDVQITRPKRSARHVEGMVAADTVRRELGGTSGPPTGGTLAAGGEGSHGRRCLERNTGSTLSAGMANYHLQLQLGSHEEGRVRPVHSAPQAAATALVCFR